MKTTSETSTGCLNVAVSIHQNIRNLIYRRATFCILVTMATAAFSFGQTTVFVKSGSSGTGASWTSAFGSITSALAASGTNDLKIYIAAGTYNAAYTIPTTRNVYIKGGYPTSAIGFDTSGYNPTSNVVNIGQSSSSGTTFSYGGASSKQFSLIGVKLTGSSTTFSAPVFNTTSAISNSTLLFKDVLIVNNSTNGRSSDGLFSFKTSLAGSTVDFENTVFGTASGTASSNSGTAIYWSGTGTSTFVFNNSALNYETTQSGDISAGFYLVGTAGSTVSITNSSFCNNTMSATNDEGTSLYFQGAGTYTVNNCYFNSNTSNANFAGAAININGFSGTANINNSGFLNNAATNSSGRGGAIYMNGATGVHFLSDNFYGNSSSGSSTVSGGAIFAENSSSFDVKSSSFYNNTVTSSGNGGAILLGSSTSLTSLDATYFAGNSKGGSTTTLGSDIYWASSSGNYSSITNSFLQLSSAASYTTSSHFTFGSGNTFSYSTVGSSPSGSCKTAVTLSISISGTVWDDANGDAIKNTSESFTNAGGLYANLVNSSNAIVSSVLVDATTGAYSFSASASTPYKIILTNGSQTPGAMLTASSLPSGWVNTGQNITGVANTANQTGIITFAGQASGTAANRNFGLDQRPSGVAISYQINPVPTRGSTHALTSAYRNMLPLGYYDPEDCASVCPSAFGVVITALTQMNGNVLAYNGTTITSSNLPYSISSYNPNLLTITFNQSGISSFTFHYQVVDAAGVQSIDPDYTAFWGGTVLAVNLLSFTAEQQGESALLKWSTAAGSMNDKFTIERSADSRNWSVLKTIAGTGSSNTRQDYSCTDNSPLSGANYYRIKQVDKNGNNVYSETRLLKFGEQWMVSLSPNPVAGGEVKLVSNQPVSILRITDLQGRTVLVKSMPVTTAQGSINEELNTNGFASGTYLVQVSNNGGKTQTLKLVKW